MSEIKTTFEAAVAASKSLSERPDNQTLLKMYALYKQATGGDASGERPGMTDFVGRAKFDAWEGLKGLTETDAMQQYIDIFDDLNS